MTIAPEQIQELFRAAGADDVEDEAAATLAETIENYIGYITEEARGQAQEADRDVITAQDIREAEQ